MPRAKEMLDGDSKVIHWVTPHQAFDKVVALLKGK
jgi:hypothetical protein